MEGRVQYNCPYEGRLCKHGKHCTAVVTTRPLKQDLAVRILCSVVKADTGGKEKELVVTIRAA